ncbi:MAG: hypothetical protein M3P18_17805 [Actinomycetota bacterium]|nr:hypothetical protein [Actinomycetota bacterium]
MTGGSLSGAVVPHAPVLLPDVSGTGTAAETLELQEALRSLVFDAADVVVVLSPHGSDCGVYASVAGTLDDFGIPGIDLQRPTDRSAVAALAGYWGKPILGDPIDHGVLVPLMLLSTDTTPVLAASLPEIAPEAVSDARETVESGISFARALVEFAGTRAVTLLASAHTSSALTPRAPLTERAEAKPVEAGILSALGDDPSTLGSLVHDAWRLGGSCSPGSLAAYARAFGGRKSEVLAYESPFGVGYVVARTM